MAVGDDLLSEAKIDRRIAEKQSSSQEVYSSNYRVWSTIMCGRKTVSLQINFLRRIHIPEECQRRQNKLKSKN